MGCVLVWNLQFLAAVDGVAGETVERLDLLVARSAAEQTLGNRPKGVALLHRVFPVGGGSGIDAHAVVGEHIVTGVLVSLRLGVGEDAVRAKLRLRVLPGFTHTVIAGGQLFRVPGRGRSGRLRFLPSRAAKLRRDLRGEVAHPGVHPAARTRLVGKPAMDGQHHLAGCRGIVQRLVLVAEPDELGLSVAFADIHAKGDEFLIDHCLECIRLRVVRRALDGDRPLVVCVGGGTPGAVLLLHDKRHTPVAADAVVAGRLLGGRREDAAERLNGALTDYAVRRDAVDAVRSLPGVVRAEFGIVHEWTVCVCHYSSPSFPARSCSCASTSFSFSGMGSPRWAEFSSRLTPSLER